MNRTHNEPLTVLKGNPPKPGWVRSQKYITILKIIFTCCTIVKDFYKSVEKVNLFNLFDREKAIATAIKDRIV